ncbi:hypothetical protein T492DRAFT_862293 [Pavlovales sp. CCMP2436]|nr:hypothetical protein T492DRAFT_862293 [Pavlovales sp. CCMP2436]
MVFVFAWILLLAAARISLYGDSLPQSAAAAALGLAARRSAVCSTLPRAWAAGGRAVHYTIYFSHRDEHVLRYNTGWNAGDAVLPWATRMAFTYFLGHPAEWIMREAHAKTTSTGLVIADDTRTLALMFVPPLYLFAVGWNEFRSSRTIPSKTSRIYRPKLLRSLSALTAKQSTLIGLREQYR